jgi:hypothetical protein
MSKVMLSFGSFVVGALVASTASLLIHRSTVAHADQTPAVVIGGAEPVVPPLSATFKGGRIGGDIQALDGLSCDDCTLDVPVLTYAGGSFGLTNAHVRQHAEIRLKGAASNTVALLAALGALPNAHPNNQPSTGPQPQIVDLTITPQDNFNLVSLNLSGNK